MVAAVHHTLRPGLQCLIYARGSQTDCPPSARALTVERYTSVSCQRKTHDKRNAGLATLFSTILNDHFFEYNPWVMDPTRGKCATAPVSIAYSCAAGPAFRHLFPHNSQHPDDNSQHPDDVVLDESHGASSAANARSSTNPNLLRSSFARSAGQWLSAEELYRLCWRYHRVLFGYTRSLLENSPDIR